MKTHLCLVGAMFITLCLNAQEYKLVWEDDFNANTIDTTYWNFEDNARGGGNGEMQYYAPKNASIETHPSGVSCLVLNAQKEDYKNRPATSARLNTQDKLSFCYGKVEIRVCLPKTANGLWPAFWMLGDNLVKDMGNDDSVDKRLKQIKKEGRVVWPRCGEIDILEMGHADGIKNGTQDRLFNGACHWGENFNNGKYPNIGMTKTTDESIQGDFHTFTLIWDADSIRMYLDKDQNPECKPYFALGIKGKGKKNHPSRYFNKPFYLVLNLAVGGYFTGLPAPEKYAAVITDDWKNFVEITNTALPKDGTPVKMYVDYIKIYQKGDKGESLNISGRK
ncbi:MAG: glycoside hydrolase family 16 protein [Paludibacteraceae bacterium]|nr:glycoside hydrolase family 16 protein [Paludibacteraceae bacterium]